MLLDAGRVRDELEEIRVLGAATHGDGSGNSKKQAEQEAASTAYAELRASAPGPEG